MDAAPPQYVLELARMHRAHPHTSREKMLVTCEDYAEYAAIWRELTPRSQKIIVDTVRARHPE